MPEEARCLDCGNPADVQVGRLSFCLACTRRREAKPIVKTASQQIEDASANLANARFAMRAAMDEVKRLSDLYTAMPKPSSDGNLAIQQAQRVYEKADIELKRSIKAFKDASIGYLDG